MKQIIKSLTASKNALQLFQNMGLRYVAFRFWFEFQRRTGILKLRFPVNPKNQVFISPEEWQNQAVHFFFKDSVIAGEINISHSDLRQLVKWVKAFHQNRVLFFSSKYFTVTDWLTNPENGFRHDISKHWSEIPDFSEEAGDIKYVWEKSRFTFLYDLIRYDYHFEKDKSDIVFKEIESWIDANPVNQGPNWKCSQEITLRVLNWTFALHYYRKSSTLQGPHFFKIIDSIHQQMRHVAENINFSRIAVRNNHALTETLGLYLIGLLFPFFKESKVWRKRGKKWFEKEIAYQIYEDGTFLQFSMNYHRVVVQLLTWGIQLAHLNNENWDPIVYDRARKSLHFLKTCQDQKSGQLPNYGNNDGALFFPLTDCDFQDFRPQLLALGNVLGEKLKYGTGAWQEESLWLGISGNQNKLETNLKNVQCSVFSKGGYYILRDQKTITFLRCGSYQNRPFQSDNLHLDIWINGKNILRDAGSFKYNTDKKWTNYFSGTASHNTVILGDSDQMRKGSGFIWFDWIKESDGFWKADGDKIIFEGWFIGFRELGKNIIIRRRVTKAIGFFHWIIEDWIENAPEQISMCQIWHPSDDFFEQFDITSNLKNGAGVKLIKTEGWYSINYGEKKSAHRIVFLTNERYLKTEIGIKIKPGNRHADSFDTSVFSGRS
ncbi:Heparinase II/III N-terminus [Dyadobacter koreensis]|uniref:Heparinase II/III N-terminus n=1 Tax=Dyadobacter koreensis TaxID=408657 RepID=A0A1H6WCI5_9BACT|nr:alginate lyase family protein [Dyadobacter koreensis]SEJ13426.1 Heparinase II/III N-terminus [Dyadobacter koreensis]